MTRNTKMSGVPVNIIDVKVACAGEVAFASFQTELSSGGTKWVSESIFVQCGMIDLVREYYKFYPEQYKYVKKNKMKLVREAKGLPELPSRPKRDKLTIREEGQRKSTRIVAKPENEEETDSDDSSESDEEDEEEKEEDDVFLLTIRRELLDLYAKDAPPAESSEEVAVDGSVSYQVTKIHAMKIARMANHPFMPYAVFLCRLKGSAIMWMSEGLLLRLKRGDLIKNFFENYKSQYYKYMFYMKEMKSLAKQKVAAECAAKPSRKPETVIVKGDALGAKLCFPDGSSQSFTSAIGNAIAKELECLTIEDSSPEPADDASRKSGSEKDTSEERSTSNEREEEAEPREKTGRVLRSSEEATITTRVLRERQSSR